MSTKGGRHPGRLSSGAKVVLTTAEANRGIKRAEKKKAAKKRKAPKKRRRRSRGIF